MAAQPDHAAWKRLGQLLEARRVDLDTRYRNRTTFTAERGLDYRLCYDVEVGARTNYRRPTLRAIEVAYAWRPGSIDRVLAGGDPEAAPVLAIVQSHDGHTPAGAVKEFMDDTTVADDLKEAVAAWIAVLRKGQDRANNGA